MASRWSPSRDHRAALIRYVSGSLARVGNSTRNTLATWNHAGTRRPAWWFGITRPAHRPALTIHGLLITTGLASGLEALSPSTAWFSLSCRASSMVTPTGGRTSMGVPILFTRWAALTT